MRRALGRARVGGTEGMLSARYRRAVAQALAALQQAAEASAPVIDLCGSQEADAAADIEGADADDEVGEHFSARQVGAWIRTHEKDELADRWDWYERVQRVRASFDVVVNGAETTHRCDWSGPPPKEVARMLETEPIAAFASPALGMYHACTSARKRAFTQEPVWRIVT